ncbi:CmpA/NrtA family ABC transporter substrate-binding protein [uncultured Methylovirgula sp.]|uniref:CmpA/NrtA family ABC transporter substrate-binding protein n=1 Tax=uncultured Methylovirgula sp. TaxID=1285960 RepID=UPI00262172DD|nr:CmpA/NrtA family ABC transporter substrate-binding protein [uncultured Methylovirgula sp.]
MSEIVSLSAARKSAAPKMRIGLLHLTDGAPVMVAHEFGFFAEEGVETELFVEPSWANIADKLAFGFLDAAVIVPPLAFAVQLGLRGAIQPLLIPSAINARGSTITLNNALARETHDQAARKDLSTVEALAAVLRSRHATLGIVHAYSTHNLYLRYWLATAGIEAGRDVKLTVVPPARAVEALTSGQISGFCAGAPWGEVARRAGAGATIATSHDIWAHAPEKAFAVRARWAEEQPQALNAALRALLRAAKFCDAPENASYTAALLARRRYFALDSHAILASLPGGAMGDGACVFYRGASTFPWRSHGLWFLNEMRRWSLVDPAVDLHDLATRVYRPDLYRGAAAAMEVPAPTVDWKDEGAHDAAWTLEAVPQPIPMPADRFCDGTVFVPEKIPALGDAAAKSALHKF